MDGDGDTRADAPTLVYQVLRSGARLALRLFYRHIEVTGIEHLAPGVPTILASTHPNSIVDPLLVGLFETRQVTFCARDGLFRVPVFGSLMRAVGAVPIQRRSDHAGPVDNDRTFAACRQVLARGGVISIFPEGKTHARLRVEPLKTGTARMAIDAERSAEGALGLVIIPVGLNYLVREAFRSDVHVSFGPPLRVAELLAELEAEDPGLAADPRALVRALTTEVSDAIRALAIHIEHRDDERLIAQVTQLIVDVRHAEGLDPEGQTPAERTALVQRIIDAYRWLEVSDPIRCARLRTWVNAYLDERRSLGLGGIDTALQGRGERRRGRADHPVLGPIGLILGAPFAAVGVITGALPYLVLRLLLLMGRPSAYRIALTKLLGGVLLFGAMFAALGYAAATVAELRPSVGAGISVALVPLLVFSHRYLIDLRLHRFGLRKNVRKLWQRSRYLRLRAERQLIQRELARLRRQYLSTLESPSNAPPIPEPSTRADSM